MTSDSANQSFETNSQNKKDQYIKILLAFFHFFLVITSYYIVKPVRDSLFAYQIGPEQLPFYYLKVAAITFVVVAIYNKIIFYIDSRRFTIWMHWLITINLLLFWYYSYQRYNISAFFYIWASTYNILVVTMFWSLTNDSFDKKNGRKYYGFVGGGGILGGILGSLIASYLPQKIGTENCLAIAAFLMTLASIITIARARKITETASNNLKPQSSLIADMQMVYRNKDVLLITKIVFFLTIAKTLFNYHYIHLIKQTIHSKNAITVFYGITNTLTNLASALFQFILTTWVLRRFGAKAGLYFTPLIFIAAMSTMLVQPSLVIVAIFNVLQQSTSYSINQSAKELLYIPCSEDIKYRTKAFIDMFIFRLGDATASILLLIIHRYLKLSSHFSLIIGTLLTGYWIYSIIKNNSVVDIDSEPEHVVS